MHRIHRSEISLRLSATAFLSSAPAEMLRMTAIGVGHRFSPSNGSQALLALHCSTVYWFPAKRKSIPDSLDHFD